MSLSDDFEDIFLSDDFFAEDIVYYADGVTATPVKAVIYRGSYKQRSQAGDRGAQSKPLEYTFSIVINRADVSAVVERLDVVDAPLDYGDTVLSRFRVQAIIRQDAGVWHLGLVK